MNNSLFSLVRALIWLTVVGLFIGLLHPYDLLVALALGAKLVLYFLVEFRRLGLQGKIMASGAIITAVLGVGAELWGIHSDYWVYHNLSGGRQFPLWLPFAWGLAFIFLYRLELRLFSEWGLRTPIAKAVTVLLISLIYPTVGEVITITLGVWHYQNLGPGIAGVPYVAMLLLMLLHAGVYLILMLFYHRKLTVPANCRTVE